MLITTTIQWISSLDPEKISEDRSYLINAQVQMKGDQFVRYDKIRFSEVGDRFDPFAMATQKVKNSYISDGASFLIPSNIIIKDVSYD
jgi:hypothetical protein